MRAVQGACVKATFVSVVLQKWYSPRGSVAMVRSTPGARARPSGEERGGRTAERHTRTGTMEKRAPRGRIFPSNGTRVWTWLLILHGLTRKWTALWAILDAPVYFFVKVSDRKSCSRAARSLSRRHRAPCRARPASVELGHVPFRAS